MSKLNISHIQLLGFTIFAKKYGPIYLLVSFDIRSDC